LAQSENFNWNLGSGRSLFLPHLGLKRKSYSWKGYLIFMHQSCGQIATPKMTKQQPGHKVGAGPPHGASDRGRPVPWQKLSFKEHRQHKVTRLCPSA